MKIDLGYFLIFFKWLKQPQCATATAAAAAVLLDLRTEDSHEKLRGPELLVAHQRNSTFNMSQ